MRTDWKVLYRAAICEIDRRVGSQKVAEAEKAVLARERELFYAPGTLEEKEDLDDALYALRALRNCLAASHSCVKAATHGQEITAEVRAADYPPATMPEDFGVLR